MVTLVIDGRHVTVPRGTTVYQAARAAGIDIPIFCYHDHMPPLGACRMCFVKVEKVPKLQTSCTLVAAEGMVVDTRAPEVKSAQEAILEFLLINHPLDCPICDKGGECPLQDQTFRWGPGRSRFVEAKRDFAKPVALGPVLALDRERCILCWRCVRFGEIVAGDDALKGFERGFASEIGTPFTLPVESKFIGNTIAICPVGALTSRTYRFRARPWDNRPVASACAHCGLGCAVWLDVRGGEILRTRAREDRAVNDIWLCDLGFFGHDYVGSKDRLTVPLIRRNGRLEEAPWDEALDLIAARLRASLERGSGRVAFLGGRGLSNEDAFIAARLFREVLRTPHLDHRLDAAPGGASMLVPWGLRATLEEIGRGDVFVLIGCDITEEYPVLWLRLKQAVDRGAVLVVVDARRPEIYRHVRHAHSVRYDRLAGAVDEMADAVGAAVEGRARDAAAPAGHGSAAASGYAAAAAAIAAGSRVHVLVGRLALEAADARSLLRAAGRIAARSGGVLHVARGRGNEIGAQRFGLAPSDGGWSAPEILRQAAAGAVDVLYVAGGDPAASVPAGMWEAARRGAGFVVVHEAFMTETAGSADAVLPALVLPEKDGSLTNLEGRTVPLRAAVPGPGRARADREIFALLAARLGALFTYGTQDEMMAGMREMVPDLGIGAVSPIPPVEAAWSTRAEAAWSTRVEAAWSAPAEAAATPGAPSPGSSPHAVSSPGASSPAAPSLILAPADRLFTQAAVTARCPGAAALAGAPHCLIHPEDAARLGVADRSLVELTTAHGAAVLQARISEATLPGQILVPLGYDALPAGALVGWHEPAPEVRVRLLEPVP